MTVLGPGHYWIEVDKDGEYTGNMCSAYYGHSDKPIEGVWKLVKEVLTDD